MDQKMDKTYNPVLWEDQIYEKWEKSGYFNPDNLNLPENAPNYTMILPPPNITAKLHIGHSSVMAIEDLFIRYHRLCGYRTLWIPGTDHAAIATQNVVEKKILAEEKKTRHDLGREKFLEKVWEFLHETQAVILKQTRKMGASIDWSRTAFTLDEDRKRAVNKMFVDMYKEGIIYRGERIVNWCPRCQSTLADDEIEYQEQKASFYTFKYDQNFPIAISTTRPETKLGDTAIAVNPKDERYKKYIDQELSANFCGQELNLKIIADINVDMNFGTGALGVTPAHSMIDSQMAIKNNLKTIKVIDEEGNIKENFGKFSGQKVLVARKMIIEELQEKNLIIKEEEINNNLSTCYRCGTAIEPLPSKQWFVSVDTKIPRLGNKSLKEKAIEAGENKKIEFIPDRFTKRYLDWMTNLHDWCISRQIWFGHEIPVWYRGEEIYVGEEKPQGKDWKQDPDTLDTWFSSGMWTFSTLGWPDNFQNGKKLNDLQKFHPTQMLETGYELITLWISRMIMMSIFALDEIPFEKVYLHGMVLDKNGKKMSKSKRNGIDPLDMIEKFGTDSLRLALLLGNTPGNDLRMSEEKIAGYRNFINKLWNISRFIISKTNDFSDDFDPQKLSLSDKWILNKLNKTIKKTSLDLSAYKFSLSGEELREFTWNDLADWYLEANKFEKDEDNKNKVLLFILKNILKLWHPFIPFITETIWQQLGEKQMLIVSSWPQAQEVNFDSEEQSFNIIQEIIMSIRNARSEHRIEPGKKLQAIILSPRNKELLEQQSHLIKSLKTGINQIKIIGDKSEISAKKNIFITLADIEIYLIGGFDEEKEKIRRDKEIANLKKMIDSIENKLNNQNFVNKAPAELVAQEKEKLNNYKLELRKILN
ncbi:MAG: valine--tRNA ligase [Patescibacteria group bacterium]|nr:valine--tRNA ligase [Patescibacteria group bacterium]